MLPRDVAWEHSEDGAVERRQEWPYFACTQYSMKKNSQNSPTCSWEGWRRLNQDCRAHLKRSASDNSSLFLLLVLMLSLSLYTSQRFVSNTLYTMTCLSLFEKDRTLSKRDFQQDWGVPVSSMALVSCFHCFNKSCSSLRS